MGIWKVRSKYHKSHFPGFVSVATYPGRTTLKELCVRDSSAASSLNNLKGPRTQIIGFKGSNTTT